MVRREIEGWDSYYKTKRGRHTNLAGQNVDWVPVEKSGGSGSKESKNRRKVGEFNQRRELGLGPNGKKERQLGGENPAKGMNGQVRENSGKNGENTPVTKTPRL